MQAIKSVGVLSCAKVMGAVYGAMGLLAIPICIVIGLASLATGEKEGAIGAVGMIILGIFAPVFYGAMGFVFGALTAWVYNLMAKWLGGIQIELQPVPASGATTTKSFGTI